MECPQPPPQALRFSHRRGERETRVTGDEPQGTMGRVQTAGEARLARCLLPAFLCAHIFIGRETSVYEAGVPLCRLTFATTANQDSTKTKRSQKQKDKYANKPNNNDKDDGYDDDDDDDDNDNKRFPLPKSTFGR